jgi:hypothetical protein
MEELDSTELAGAELGATELAGTELGATELAGTELGATELAGTELGATELAGTELGATELAGTELGATELAGMTTILDAVLLAALELSDATEDESGTGEPFIDVCTDEVCPALLELLGTGGIGDKLRPERTFAIKSA